MFGGLTDGSQRRLRAARAVCVPCFFHNSTCCLAAADTTPMSPNAIQAAMPAILRAETRSVISITLINPQSKKHQALDAPHSEKRQVTPLQESTARNTYAAISVISPVNKLEVAWRYSRFDISPRVAGSSPERFLWEILSPRILSSLSRETPLHSDASEPSSQSKESG